MLGKLALIFYFSLAAKLVEYRLGYNYGQVFHDFSGNSMDGVNGFTSAVEASDTLQTDRGACFPGLLNTQITLPNNDQQSSQLTLSSTFTIAAWLFSYQQHVGTVFYRYKDSNNYFYLKHNPDTTLVTARIVMGGNDSTEIDGPSGSFNHCK